MWDQNKLAGDQFLGLAAVDIGGRAEAEGQGVFPLLPRQWHDDDALRLQQCGVEDFGQVTLKWAYESDGDVQARCERLMAQYTHLEVPAMA